MENLILNLYEGRFPIKVNKNYKGISGLETLGKIEDYILVSLSIEKTADELFLARGHMEVKIKANCQKCFKKTLINLKVETNVGIKDIQFENIDKEGTLEIHYQDLEKFNLNDLITEEIYLNFPSIVICCAKETNEITDEENLNKIRPFKKIRDLTQ